MIRSVLIIIICSVFEFFCIEARDVTDDSLKINEKEKIESFFQYLVTKTEFGYTLCGEKPVSVLVVSKDGPHITPFSFFDSLCFNTEHLIFDYYKLCRKSTDLLKSDNFAFKEIEWNQSPCLMIINLSELRKKISENLSILNRIFKSENTSEEILQRVLDLKEIDIFKNDNAFLGFILGFGINNSIAFENRRIIENQLKYWLGCAPPLSASAWYLLTEREKKTILDKPIYHFSQNFTKIKDPEILVRQWRDLKNKLVSLPHHQFDHNLDLSFVTSPGFAIYNDSKNQAEVNRLNESYQNTKKKICEKYQRCSFTKTSLEILKGK